MDRVDKVVEIRSRQLRAILADHVADKVIVASLLRENSSIHLYTCMHGDIIKAKISMFRPLDNAKNVSTFFFGE